jgi:hypothetical protein
MSKKNVTPMAAPLIDIGIKGKDREKIVQGLSRVLADTYTLYLKTHNFHWNVEGPMFNTLHLMFMDQYTELWNALDAIAERVRSLGYPAPKFSLDELRDPPGERRRDPAARGGDPDRWEHCRSHARGEGRAGEMGGKRALGRSLPTGRPETRDRALP